MKCIQYLAALLVGRYAGLFVDLIYDTLLFYDTQVRTCKQTNSNVSILAKQSAESQPNLLQGIDDQEYLFGDRQCWYR